MLSPANTCALLVLRFPRPTLPITSPPLSLFESFAAIKFETVAASCCCCKYALVATNTPPIKRPLPVVLEKHNAMMMHDALLQLMVKSLAIDTSELYFSDCLKLATCF